MISQGAYQNTRKSAGRIQSPGTEMAMGIIIATYAINIYTAPARLFVIGGKQLMSSKGTTQGDPLTMSLYAISLQPLITILGIRSSAKQCWYAEDATGAGTMTDIRKWWDELLAACPA